MTEDDSWKLVVTGLKHKAVVDRKRQIAEVLSDVAGEDVPIRAARRSLLTLSVRALASKPCRIDVHGEGVVFLISSGDLLDILADPPPTLAEVLGKSKL
ncbi:hypothetical protein HFO49_09390 [Rhizobium leguminosarum]|uniref:hypothetical protein n=1 Tax=Rhizobium leguminosarum TaxID=384 RepID=UPI001C9570A6|nr:hypothetical protein [Rhizobium leguminosarum]MBY5587697.1 hypothetical protein [Rhizobium leguminosarum]